MNNTLKIALDLAQQGYKTFPLAPNSKVPLKGSAGFKMASSDPGQLKRWFENTNNNIGLLLTETNLSVIDVDINHGSGDVNVTENSINGVDNFREILVKHDGNFPADTRVEKSANGGLHYFLTVPDKTNLKTKQSAFKKQSGIDILVNGGVMIYPSVVDGKPYDYIQHKDLADVKPAPQWVLDELRPHSYNPAAEIQRTTGKKYTGVLIDFIVAGAGTGERNVWMTQLAGKLLNADTSPQATYNMMLVANSNFLDKPLEEKEINSIFKSILQREVNKINGQK
ncbi:bifunctional DNA primase/polymerase [Paucilactobacillus nenjiangensis]|jgi:hypothetical protein|uniref:bifunctional DNA primase/polymerase n=1 Tax=Paucilactobacillus nenjiangensis TaxID=1296540 RepID=UPI003BB0D1CE